MRFRTYLVGQWPQITAIAAAAALSALVALGTSGSPSVAVLAASVAAVCPLLALIAEYLRRRPFLRALDACATDLEHPSWSSALLPEPDYPEGHLAWEALQSVARAATSDISTYRRQTIDYREYIETWVHEAKSPLAAANLMVENLSPDIGGARANALAAELDRTEGYIEQALFFARSESLEQDYLIRCCTLAELVSHTLKAHARLLIGAHVAPKLTDLDHTVFTDEKWMHFILGQLIDNAVKYARAEGAELSFSARLLDDGSAAERVELTVRDNGCGVAASDLPRVFERGFTGQNGRTREHATGLGLYLVRTLCEKMGLDVGADSVEGAWFAVHITFPTNKMHFIE